MKIKNLSVKRLFGRVAMGLVLFMSGITIVLFFVTKQIAYEGNALILFYATITNNLFIINKLPHE